MWLFTTYGFFSVASAWANEDKKTYTIDPDNMMIRSRVKQHLVNLQDRFDVLTEYEIKTSVTNDYMFRMMVPKAIWVNCIAELASEQMWSNFKDECHENEERLGKAFVMALHAVWGIMLKLQPFRSLSGLGGGAFAPPSQRAQK